ncbi:MAG: hypothetical protein F6K62_00945 [Sphaerospermopsis sp. SIO1G2]|nr:hypothetical protein [Sphaerospermopsis sp. SIO1G2]
MAQQPTANEQYMLTLVNRMRINPADEYAILTNDPSVQPVLSFFGVDLNVLQQQWDTLVPTNPLAWSDQLNLAADNHNQLMISFDQQSHQLPGEPGLGQRITNTGYQWIAAAENVFAFAESVFYGHAGFAIDWGDDDNNPGNGFGTGIQNPAGHRNSIMNSNYREIGIDIIEENDPNTSVGPLVITQNFGNRSAINNQAWLLGTVFEDLDGDTYYSLGEGLNNVVINVTGIQGTTFNDTLNTWDAGGYQILLNPGDYQVEFSQNGNILESETVNVGTENVLLDVNASDTNNDNQAPTALTLSNNNIDENVAASTTVGTFSTIDPDQDTSFTYSLITGTGDTDNNLFAIVGNQLQSDTVFNYENDNSYSIRVQVTDPGGLSYAQQFTIAVNNVNENPTDISLTNNNVDENSSVGTVIGTLSTTDTDLGDTHQYQLLEGNNDFEIVGNQLRTKTVFNYETENTFNVKVKTTDTGGLSYEENFVINVNDINEAPQLNNSIANQSVDNNSTFNFTIPNATFSDPDGDNLTYSVSGTPSWLSFDAGTQTFSGTANSIGTNTITVSANDGSNTTNTTFDLIVKNPTTNISNNSSIIDESSSTDPVYIIADSGDNNIFGGSNHDKLQGGDGNDIIRGNAGNDRLYGEGGNDTLYGGVGTDIMYGDLLTSGGNSGNDIFVIEPGNGLDIVVDFADGFDRLGLTGGLTFGTGNSSTDVNVSALGSHTMIQDSSSVNLMLLLNVNSNLIDGSDFVDLAV